ncbi:TNF receptor-associated factor 5 [Trichonephila inaurata madagascariensis]|uniref:TNF receptor-associated factor 5 n=1 Tax=Trichonephila inaurata madagascariensis TaxID=2747483 RepID=A0A8X6XN07_9ARAC|nr:TNF receptor-associated factor 5 [Trichonephila inaurata madagascariensis]
MSGFQLKPNSFAERVGRTLFESNPYISKIPPIGSHSFVQERKELPQSSPYTKISGESRPYTEEASEVSPHVPREGIKPKSPSYNEDEASVRFAITVFLQELTPPVASLRLEAGVLVAKYLWTIPSVTANLELLQSLEKNRL